MNYCSLKPAPLQHLGVKFFAFEPLVAFYMRRVNRITSLKELYTASSHLDSQLHTSHLLQRWCHPSSRKGIENNGVETIRIWCAIPSLSITLTGIRSIFCQNSSCTIWDNWLPHSLLIKITSSPGPGALDMCNGTYFTAHEQWTSQQSYNTHTWIVDQKFIFVNQEQTQSRDIDLFTTIVWKHPCQLSPRCDIWSPSHSDITRSP